MTPIDTSPAALRALADSAANVGNIDQMRGALRAVAAEKEKGQPVTLVAFDDFDDYATADAIRALGIQEPTMLQVTGLQKAMAHAYRMPLPGGPEA